MHCHFAARLQNTAACAAAPSPRRSLLFTAPPPADRRPRPKAREPKSVSCFPAPGLIPFRLLLSSMRSITSCQGSAAKYLHSSTSSCRTERQAPLRTASARRRACFIDRSARRRLSRRSSPPPWDRCSSRCSARLCSVQNRQASSLALARSASGVIPVFSQTAGAGAAIRCRTKR